MDPGNASKDSRPHVADGSGSEGRLTALAPKAVRYALPIGQSTAKVLARPSIGGLTQRSGSARVIDFPVLGLHRCKKREFAALSADLRDDVLVGSLNTVERLEHLRKLQAALEKRLAENLKSSDQITN